MVKAKKKAARLARFKQVKASYFKQIEANAGRNQIVSLSGCWKKNMSDSGNV